MPGASPIRAKICNGPTRLGRSRVWPPSSQIQGLAFTTSVKLTHTYSDLCLWRASVNSASHLSRHWGEGRAGLGLRLSLALQSQLSLDAIMKCVHVLPHLSFLPGFCHLVEDGLDERRAGLSTRAQTYRPCPMCSLLDTDGCHPTHSTGASQKLDTQAGHASWRHELTALFRHCTWNRASKYRHMFD